MDDKLRRVDGVIWLRDKESGTIVGLLWILPKYFAVNTVIDRCANRPPVCFGTKPPPL